jgi:hypothetical protein
MITTWLDAFENNVKYKKGNYKVLIDVEKSTCLYLFDNLIAKKDIYGDILITTSGYNTLTTIKTLNKVLNGFPIIIKNIKERLTLNSVFWDGEWVSANSIMNVYDTK